MVLQESGEHVLITAGEVHLQRCLQDLRETYAKIEINASQPIVPFRETIISPSEGTTTDADNSNAISITTPNKSFSARIRAVPLPEEVTTLLDKNVDIIKAMRQPRGVRDSLDTAMAELQLEESFSSATRSKVAQLRDELDQALRNAGWRDAVNNILSFGPRRCGPNILLNQSSRVLPSLWSDTLNPIMESSLLNQLSSVISGFQLATLSGPLCDEPLMGVCFILEELSLGEPAGESESQQPQSVSGVGQIISSVKEGCRKAFQSQPQRLMAAMYNCSIQVSGEVVGKCPIYIQAFRCISRKKKDDKNYYDEMVQTVRRNGSNQYLHSFLDWVRTRNRWGIIRRGKALIKYRHIHLLLRHSGKTNNRRRTFFFLFQIFFFLTKCED